MDILIREAKSEDMQSVLDMIRELALYEKAPEEVWITKEDLVKDGFGDDPCFRVNVAEFNGEIVGISLFFIGYSTWKGKLLFLDDLVVKESMRNKGIGRLLMDSVIEHARSIDARIIKWQVLNWNSDAMKFYEKYDPVQDDEWVDYKMFKDQISNYEK